MWRVATHPFSIPLGCHPDARPVAHRQQPIECRLRLGILTRLRSSQGTVVSALEAVARRKLGAAGD